MTIGQATLNPSNPLAETAVSSAAGRLSRLGVLLYGTVVYGYFLGLFLYLVGWVANLVVPLSIDRSPVGQGWAAVGLNLLPLSVFAIQHTVMARPAFKRWWTRIIPPAAERTTFVAITCAILTWLVLQWQSLPAVVWHFDGAIGAALLSFSMLGWAVVLVSTFLIDHFDLFGVKQVIHHFRGKPLPEPQFRERLFYRYTRHPLMLGFLIAFWATPTMTVGHLLFASVVTAYVLVALVIEERTLVELHGDSYEDYRRRVPKLIPRLIPRASARQA